MVVHHMQEDVVEKFKKELNGSAAVDGPLEVPPEVQHVLPQPELREKLTHSKMAMFRDSSVE